MQDTSFTRIFGKAGKREDGEPIPPEKTLEFLRSINPDIPEEIDGFEDDRNYNKGYVLPEKVEEEDKDEDAPSDDDKKCSFEGVEGSDKTGPQTLENDTTIEVKCLEATPNGGGKFKCENGELKGISEGATTKCEKPKKCTFEPQDGSTIDEKTEVEHGKTFKLECKSGTHVGGGVYTCKNGTLEESDGFNNCTKKPTPGPSETSDGGADDETDSESDSPGTTPGNPDPDEQRPEPRPAVREPERRESTRESSSTESGDKKERTSLSVKPDRNPCVDRAKNNAIAAAESSAPQIPTKATCNKANEAFKVSLKELGDFELNDKKFSELQKKRDELKRRLALHTDMEHMIQNFNNVLKGIIDLSPDDPEKILQAIEGSSSIREFQGLSFALDEVLKEDASTAYLFNGRPQFSQRVESSCSGEKAKKPICKLIKQDDVKRVINNFGIAFNRAFECQGMPSESGKQRKEKAKCQEESKKSLTDFQASMAPGLENIVALKSLAEQKRKLIENPGDTSDKWGPAGGPRISMARLSKNIVINSLPTMYGLDANAAKLKADSIEQFFGRGGTLNDPKDNSFLNWVKKGCAQRVRNRYAKGENYQAVMDSYNKDPKKAMTDFLDDVTTELKGLCKQEVKPGKKCPKNQKFCHFLGDCLNLLNKEKEKGDTSLIVRANKKMKGDLDAINDEIKKMRANKSFTNKLLFTQSLADYVSFCEEHKLIINQRKVIEFCPKEPGDAQKPDNEKNSLELLLDSSGKIISQIDPLINMGRKIPSDQLYVLSGQLADRCRMKRYGTMEESSGEAGKICSEASKFVDKSNDSSCQSQEIRKQLDRNGPICARKRALGHACIVNAKGEIQSFPFNQSGVSGWGEFFTESLSQIASSANIFMAAMTGFEANLMASQASDLSQILPQTVPGIYGQQICNSYSASNFHHQLFGYSSQHVLSSNPILAQQATPGTPYVAAPPPMFQPTRFQLGGDGVAASCIPITGGAPSVDSGSRVQF